MFFKGAASRVSGHNGPIRIRRDASWNVPEPEIAVLVAAHGGIAGYTVGNDVSSRDIEGENPLYLPQAKVYAGGVSLGPCVVPPVDGPLEIRMRILGPDGAEMFAGETSTARMRRSFDDLVSWLLRDNPVPPGSVLLTGTGLVPPDDFTLEPGQRVEIHVPGIGTLVNDVALATDLLPR